MTVSAIDASAPVPALGQLSPPPENFTWGPLYSQAKWKVRWFYTECDFHPILHFMHIRAIFNVGYVFTQNAFASDFASTNPSLKSTHVL